MVSTLIPPPKVKVNSKLDILESEITKALLTINLLPNILKMPPLRGKIHRLPRPELLLAKNLFPSLAPPAPAEGDKEPGHLRTRHSEVEPVVVVVVSCLPRLAWMVTWESNWESNCMMMMKKTGKSCRPGWLGWSPGSATA